jgi:DNA-binding CsgD family transcriptional regulator
MDTLRIIALEIVSTLPFPAAAWVIFYKLHTPPTKARRVALAAAIIAWILGWRFFEGVYNKVPSDEMGWFLEGWWLAGLAAFALLSGNIRLTLFSAAFYTGITDWSECLLYFLSRGALAACGAYDNLAYLARAVCSFGGLAWAIAYRRLMRNFTGRLPIAYGVVTALVPFLTILLLYAFGITIEREPETASALYLWGGLFGGFLLLFNIAVFFLYIKLNTAKSETADARTATAEAVASAIAVAEQRAAEAAAQTAALPTAAIGSATHPGSATQPFTLSERFIEKYGITPAQQRVAEAALAGMSDKEIAAALGLSVNTVKWHLKTVYQITGVKSRHALTALALDEA